MIPKTNLISKELGLVMVYGGSICGLELVVVHGGGICGLRLVVIYGGGICGLGLVVVYGGGDVYGFGAVADKRWW